MAARGLAGSNAELKDARQAYLQRPGLVAMEASSCDLHRLLTLGQTDKMTYLRCRIQRSDCDYLFLMIMFTGVSND